MTTRTPDITDGVSWSRKLFRMWPAWLVSAALLVTVYYIAPQQIGVIAYKAVFLTLGAVVGYWIHVWSLGYIGDDLNVSSMQHAAWRRAVFIVGAMIAFALAA